MVKLESNRIYNKLNHAMYERNHLNNAISNSGGDVHPSEYTRLSALNNKVKEIFKKFKNALNKEKLNLGLNSIQANINKAAKKVNAYRQGKENSLNQLRKNYGNRSSQAYLKKKGQLNRNYDALIKRSRNNLNRLLKARNLRKRILNKKPTPNQARRTIYNRVFARHINKLLYHPTSGTRSSAMLNAYEPITRVRAAKLIREAERRGFTKGRGSR